MRLVIVTGMSGAGKSTTLKMLEDEGYFCIDNLPIVFMAQFSEVLKHQDSQAENIAIGLDIRSGEVLKDLERILDDLKVKQIKYEILFLESSNDVLVRRYKETRRMHPLSLDGRVDAGIEEERKKTSFLKRRADYILDTSRMLTRELKVELRKIFVENKSFANLHITILSFGFKYGIPNDADLLFDVRFLPNPYYVPELRPQSGDDEAVKQYVMDNKDAHEFLWRIKDLLTFLIPNYIAEGKHQLVIAVGCTGGKHRSVTLANEMYAELVKEETYGIQKEHRDIEKDGKKKQETEV